MSLTADQKEQGYWRYILLDGRYQHNHPNCHKCDFLYLACEASAYYRMPLEQVNWKNLGFIWTCAHPRIMITPPTESQILWHAKQPNFSFLEFVELRAKSLY
jgi:hypothetical protein